MVDRSHMSLFFRVIATYVTGFVSSEHNIIFLKGKPDFTFSFIILETKSPKQTKTAK